MSDQPPGLPSGVDAGQEMQWTKVLVVDAIADDMPCRDEQTVPDRDQRALLPAARRQPAVLGARIGVSCAGGGSGVLTYRGRDYPFRVSGLSLGVTAGASVSRLKGWASGIRQVSDFAGTYSSVGGGGTFVGGFGGVQLGNEKGVKIALQGPRAGMEFAANLSGVRISLK